MHGVDYALHADSRLIRGRRYHRAFSVSCACGRPDQGVFIELGDDPVEDYASLFAVETWNGRPILSRIGGQCLACVASDSLMGHRPGIQLDRVSFGIHKSLISETVAFLRDRGGARRERQAAILEEVAASFPNDPTVRRAAFELHPGYEWIKTLIADLADQAGGTAAAFDVGRVSVERVAEDLWCGTLLSALLDRHARLDAGLLGPIPDKASELAEWCPYAASPGEQSRISLDVGDGVVRSAYRLPDRPDGRPWTVEVCTWLEPKSLNETYVLSIMGEPS